MKESRLEFSLFFLQHVLTKHVKWHNIVDPDMEQNTSSVQYITRCLCFSKHISTYLPMQPFGAFSQLTCQTHGGFALFYHQHEPSAMHFSPSAWALSSARLRNCNLCRFSNHTPARTTKKNKTTTFTQIMML